MIKINQEYEVRGYQIPGIGLRELKNGQLITDETLAKAIQAYFPSIVCQLDECPVQAATVQDELPELHELHELPEPELLLEEPEVESEVESIPEVESEVESEAETIPEVESEAEEAEVEAEVPVKVDGRRKKNK